MNSEKSAEVLQRINGCDSTLNESEVIETVRSLCAHWLRTAKHVEMKGVDGAPDWTAYEGKIWELGESVRQCLIKRKPWRSWVAFFDVVSEIVADRQYGKGRESWVLLLGDFSAAAYRDLLVRLLDDPDVTSHAITALRHGKVDDAIEEVRAVLGRTKSSRTRSSAKKYLSQFGSQ